MGHSPHSPVGLPRDADGGAGQIGSASRHGSRRGGWDAPDDAAKIVVIPSSYAPLLGNRLTCASRGVRLFASSAMAGMRRTTWTIALPIGAIAAMPTSVTAVARRAWESSFQPASGAEERWLLTLFRSPSETTIGHGRAGPDASRSIRSCVGRRLASAPNASGSCLPVRWSRLLTMHTARRNARGVQRSRQCRGPSALSARMRLECRDSAGHVTISARLTSA